MPEFAELLRSLATQMILYLVLCLLIGNSYNQLDRIRNQIDMLKQEQNIEVVPVIRNGIQNIQKWIIWIKGKPNTVWAGGIYPLQIKFNQNFPRSPPQVFFEQDFEHIHVYQGGNICLPVVDEEYWKPSRTMRQVIGRLETFIHQNPNQYSPANCELLELFVKQPQEYEKKMKAQACRYSKKDPKYFNQSCVHIDIC